MFHERLDALCKSKGISITDFSVNKLGVSNSAATSWKKGAIPRSDIVIKAAKYFGVSTDYLLGLENLTNTNINARCAIQLALFAVDSCLP